MSIETLCGRDEITVFEVVYSDDDMMSTIETKSSKRRKLKCRMVPMGGAEKVAHEIPIIEEVYKAYFAADPELTLKHMAIFGGNVFDVIDNDNLSGQDWAWEVTLRHHPGLQITV